MKKESFFAIQILVITLRDDQRSHGLIDHLAWGTCVESPWAYILEGLLSEGFLRLRFGGLFSGGLIFFGGGGGGGGL